MGLDASHPSKYNSPSTIKLWGDEEPYTYHFPEGNAGISRLLVRNLIPGSLPGKTMEDEVLAQLDYGKLDAASNRVRIRLGSPVVRVKHLGDPATASEVEVCYVQGGKLKTVRAKGTIMACWYSMLPYIVDGYPSEQREAAASMGRAPLAYANVLVRSRSAFEKMKVWGGRDTGPGVAWTNFYLDWPVSMGGYEYPMNYDGAGVIHFSGHPTRAEMPLHEATEAGRQDMFATPFSDYERSLRELLGKSMAAGGFDPAEEIQAITVNRWAHGYSLEYQTPFDNAFYPDGPFPGDIASKPYGQITFANSDRGPVAYMDVAIDAGSSAVDEQLAGQ
jgi:spermidine dehydrogenase